MDIKTALFMMWKYSNATIKYNPNVRQWWVTVDFEHPIEKCTTRIQFFIETNKPENKDIIEVCEAYAREQDRVKNKA